MPGNERPIEAVALMVVVALIAVTLMAMFSTVTLTAQAVNTPNVLTATVNVLSSCQPVLSNTLIYFPSTQPGFFAPTANAINVISQGNAGANILVSGGNWVSGALSFWVYNTLWSNTLGQNIGTQLTNTIIGVDTKIPILPSGGNVVWFGVNVPVGQPAGTYTQTINVLTSC